MRLSIEYGSYIWPSVWWNASNNESLLGRNVSIVFTPEVNWWKGQGKEQLNIIAIEPID